MKRMDSSIAKIDLTKVPFGRTRSRFMVFEENNLDRDERRPGSGTVWPKVYPVQKEDPNDVDFPLGLYFAFCAQGGASPRRRGLMDIVPIHDGQPLNYTYTATPSCLRLDTDKGSIRIVIDTPATMRIAGDGVGLRLYVKLPFLSMMNGLKLPSGIVEYNVRSVYPGGGVFFFHSIKGEITIDAKFDPLLNGPEYIHAEFLPDENGRFEVGAYSMSPDEWGYIDYKPFDECADGAEKEFKEFLAKFPATGEKWRNLAELSAYALWINYQDKSTSPILPTLQSEMIYTNIIREGQAKAYEQPLFALAMDDVQGVAELIKNNFPHMRAGMLPALMSDSKPYYKAFPPTFGIALSHLLAIGGVKLSKGELDGLYNPLAEHYEWWIKSHSLSKDRVSYNTRDEYGWQGASYGVLPFPLETPDLYTYMILYTQALSKLSALIGDGGESEWTAASERLMDSLLSLWDGERFMCRGASSGIMYRSDSLLTYIPILLAGCGLSDDIKASLIAALGCDDAFLSKRGFRSESKASPYYNAAAAGRGDVDAAMQMLIIGGLSRAGGADEIFENAARAVLAAMDEFGVRDSLTSEGVQPIRRPADEINPIGGAALIYLANLLSCRGKE